MSKAFDVGRAIARAERVDNLREAECNAAWVIHVPRIKRVRSTSEREAKRVVDSASCMHDVSYTMPCKNCRRTNVEAKANRESIARKLLNLNTL
jgi:hypothetical protein